MVTVPETNRILWDALDAIYSEQRDGAQRAQQALSNLKASHPELAQDSLAHEALKAAVARQNGVSRYAESQLALVATMRAYWEQRTATAEPALVPLIRRANPLAPSPLKPRAISTAD